MELPAKLIADPPEAESSPSGIARYVAQPAVEPGGGQLSIEGESARGELGSARRGMPTRAEDVLGLGLGRAQVSSLWWSREPRPPAAGALPAVRQRPAAAITTGTGLPQRVPMAQLPSEAVPAAAVRSEADPDEVGTTLSRFYDGVHRAAAEDADLQTAR
jgi:hypothetical protein